MECNINKLLPWTELIQYPPSVVLICIQSGSQWREYIVIEFLGRVHC